MDKRTARRTQKVARRKAKRKAAHSTLPATAGALRVPEAAPVLQCLVASNLFDMGIGHVVVAREVALGQVAAAMFLLDVFCLGVKDVFYGTFSPGGYRERVELLLRDVSVGHLPAPDARVLVEGAVAYAEVLGIPPHDEYRVAQRIFGGIHRAIDHPGYAYGKDGKPLYVAGPNDTPAKSRRILRALEESCGPGGYDYILTEY